VPSSQEDANSGLGRLWNPMIFEAPVRHRRDPTGTPHQQKSLHPNPAGNTGSSDTGQWYGAIQQRVTEQFTTGMVPFVAFEGLLGVHRTYLSTYAIYIPILETPSPGIRMCRTYLERGTYGRPSVE
jgi:hypothetical protein